MALTPQDTPRPDRKWTTDGRISFQALWHASEYAVPDVEVVDPRDTNPEQEPYIAVHIGGVRIAFYSSSDARDAAEAILAGAERFDQEHADDTLG